MSASVSELIMGLHTPSCMQSISHLTHLTCWDSYMNTRLLCKWYVDLLDLCLFLLGVWDDPLKDIFKVLPGFQKFLQRWTWPLVIGIVPR